MHPVSIHFDCHTTWKLRYFLKSRFTSVLSTARWRIIKIFTSDNFYAACVQHCRGVVYDTGILDYCYLPLGSLWTQVGRSLSLFDNSFIAFERCRRGYDRFDKPCRTWLSPFVFVYLQTVLLSEHSKRKLCTSKTASFIGKRYHLS